jgi:hypothetical protein
MQSVQKRQLTLPWYCDGMQNRQSKLAGGGEAGNAAEVSNRITIDFPCRFQEIHTPGVTVPSQMSSSSCLGVGGRDEVIDIGVDDRAVALVHRHGIGRGFARWGSCRLVFSSPTVMLLRT